LDMTKYIVTLSEDELKKTKRTHCQGQKKISNNPQRADSPWM